MLIILMLEHESNSDNGAVDGNGKSAKWGFSILNRAKERERETERSEIIMARLAGGLKICCHKENEIKISCYIPSAFKFYSDTNPW